MRGEDLRFGQNLSELFLELAFVRQPRLEPLVECVFQAHHQRRAVGDLIPLGRRFRGLELGDRAAADQVVQLLQAELRLVVRLIGADLAGNARLSEQIANAGGVFLPANRAIVFGDDGEHHGQRAELLARRRGCRPL